MANVVLTSFALSALTRAGIAASTTALMLGGCASAPDQGHVASEAAAVQSWGTIDGKPVYLYTLENADGLIMKVTNYGAIITELHTPDARGEFADIVLGYDSLDGYIASTPYFGCIAGRNANRVAKGQFELDGETYQLALNNGPNHLHGGVKGFDKHVWDAKLADTPDGPSIILERVSPDGEENYPGELTATVTYTLTDDNELRTEIRATTSAPTLCDLAQHAYWNLAGHDAGSTTGQILMINADAYTPVDATLIPTGELAPVRGTPFDFRQAKPISQDLAGVDGGYDHNFVVRGEAAEIRPVLTFVDPGSGRRMDLSANQPGVQFYGGNFLDGSLVGKGGVRYEKYDGVCFETQFFPDAINQDGWTSPVLRPGEEYYHIMISRFSAEGSNR